MTVRDLGSFYDLYFIYHPDDGAFLGRAAAQMQASGINCHFDALAPSQSLDSAPLKANLLRAYTVGIVLSPASAESQLCNELIQYAVRNSKTLLTLILDDDIAVEVHPAIAENAYVFFREQDDLLSQIELLRQQLRLDPATKLHTELLVAADAWQQRDRSPELLLPPEQVAAARDWLAAGAALGMKVSPLLVEYIHRSRRQKPARNISLARRPIIALTALGLLGLGFLLLRAALAGLTDTQARAAQTSAAQTPLALTAAAATAINSSALGTVDALAATSASIAAAVSQTAQAGALTATQAARASATAQSAAQLQATQARATDVYELAQAADARQLIEAGDAALVSGDADLALALAWAAKDRLDTPKPAYRLLRRALAEADSGTVATVAPAALPGASLSPSGETLLVIEDSGISLRDTATQETKLELPPGLIALAGPHFAHYDGETVRLRALETGAESQRWQANWEDTRALYLAPDVQTLLVATASDALWLLRQGSEEPQRLPAAAPAEVIFAPDGQRFLSLQAERALLWEVESAEALATYPLGGVSALELQAAFSAAGDSLVFFAQLENGLAGLTVTALADDSARRQTFVDVVAGALTADGQFLALALADGSAQIIETASGATVYQLPLAAQSISKLQYRPAENLLVVAAGRALSFWHAPTAMLEVRFSQPAPIVDFQLSGDNRRALTRDAAGLYRLWQSEDPADFLARIEATRRPRSLTCAEREDYLVLPLCE